MEDPEVRIINYKDIEPCYVSEHTAYEYFKYDIEPRRPGCPGKVAVYEILPGKSNYPYHYHTQSEEVFYILSGTGTLDSPEGKRTVTAGDFVVCPTGEKGAHKLTNTSEKEKLVYIDFDTVHSPEIIYYPDSNKVGIYIEGKDEQFFIEDTCVDYYEGE